MKGIKWSIKDLFEIAKERQNNKLDFIICWSGKRGSGKSTGSYRFCSKFKIFKPKKHIVYDRKQLMQNLELMKYGVIMDDEAIRTGYKRNFFDSEQKLFVQLLNMYRDHFNIYSLCIPNFYSLDKDLRDLIKVHIQVIRRGVAAIHIPNDDSLYSEDKWDIKINQRIEENYMKRKLKNPTLKMPYHKLTTFRGYIRYSALPTRIEEKYLKIKEENRKKIYQEELIEMNPENKKEKSIYENLTDLILKEQISTEDLIKYSEINSLNYNKFRSNLRNHLSRRQNAKELKFYLRQRDKKMAKNGYQVLGTLRQSV